MDIILIHTVVLIDNFELRSVSGSYHLAIRIGNILYTNCKPLFRVSASKFPLNIYNSHRK